MGSVRRQYQEMRHDTVKEINKLKVEKALQVSTACLESSWRRVQEEREDQLEV